MEAKLYSRTLTSLRQSASDVITVARTLHKRSDWRHCVPAHSGLRPIPPKAQFSEGFRVANPDCGQRSKQKSGSWHNDVVRVPFSWPYIESSWNVMAHGDARVGKWRGNRRVEWIASTLHTASEHGVSSVITADAHSSAASSRLNWRPCWFKWTRPFRRKTKSGFCACAITFQTLSSHNN